MSTYKPVTLGTAEGVAALLREARLDSGLTAAQVGQKAYICGPMVTMCERGRRIPSVPALIRLLDVLGYDLQAVRR